MKYLYCIYGMSVPQHLRGEISSIYPAGFDELGNFKVRLALDDPKVQQIQGWLDRNGFKPWLRTKDINVLEEYPLNIVREYEDDDLKTAEYLNFLFRPFPGIDNVGRDEQGRILVERPTVIQARELPFDFVWSVWSVLVEQRTYDFLKQTSLLNLMFKPTVLCKGRGLYEQRRVAIPWEQFKSTGPWWELSSQVVMPRLSPTVDVRDKNNQGGPPPDRIRGCEVYERLYAPSEFHYRRSEIKSIEPFDVALTFENFGYSNNLGYRLIISQRFYAYCVQKGLRARWQPVRVDEE